MASKSAKEYADEYYSTGKKKLDEQHEQQVEQDNAYIQEITDINNKAAQNTADKYQQQIDQAPVASRALYDANALDEAIGKKKLQESMANMGLTDSGLSGSMQTALALQKTRSDAGVRRQEREYVQSLETAIADVWAQTEAANAQLAANRRQTTNDSYNQALSELYNSTATAGATAYAADVEANTKATEQANELAINQAELQIDRENKMAETVQKLMDENDYDYNTAIVLATQMYGGVNTVNADGSTNQDAVKQNQWNANYIAAIGNGFSPSDATIYANAGGGENGETAVYERRIKTAKVDTTALTEFDKGGWWGWITTAAADKKNAENGSQATWNSSIKSTAGKARKNAIKEGLDDSTAEYAAAVAVGQTIKDIIDKDNMTMVYNALCDEFSGTALTAAVAAAGLQAKSVEQ